MFFVFDDGVDHGSAINSTWFHGINCCSNAVRGAIGWSNSSLVSITLADRRVIDQPLQVESLTRFCPEDL